MNNKFLYEIITSSLGESYVRSYAWATCEEDAREMFKAFSEYEIVKVVELFGQHSDEFCTKPSDNGFELEGQLKITDLSKFNTIKLRGPIQN